MTPMFRARMLPGFPARRRRSLALLRRSLALLPFLFGALALAPGRVAADVTEFPVRGVTLVKELTVPVPPAEAWDLFTGDVSGWWDHTFSGKPYRLVIDRTVGGGFWEYFDAEGHGVKHAEIQWAEPGKVLKMRGPLGFSGKAVDLVHTFVFAPDGPDGAGTRITLTLNALGQLDEDGVAALDQVWDHFLLERYRGYVLARADRK